MTTDTLENRMAEVGRSMEATLTRLLDAAHAAGCPQRLGDAMRHGVLGGGKRLRPFLMFECARVFGIGEQDVHLPAAALELVHCYSLVHDDLPAMDNDLFRRGRPTVWSAFDDWTAILAGDALLTLAFETLCVPEAHADARVRSELCVLLARAAGPAGMVGGQALDLAAEKLGHPAAPDRGHIARLQAIEDRRLDLLRM